MRDHIYVVMAQTEGSGHGYAPSTRPVRAFERYWQANEYTNNAIARDSGWAKYYIETVGFISEKEALPQQGVVEATAQQG